MTGRLVAFAVALLTPATAYAQHFHHHVEAAPGDEPRVSVCKKEYAVPEIDRRLPKVPWPVTTDKDLARQHFEQGMALYYGFNYEDALRNFDRATKIDPDFVMGWWGMALAAGPNINLGIDDYCLKMAKTWSGEAWSRAQRKLSPSSLEYQLAKALPVRYDGPVVQTTRYADAMKAVWNVFERDLDPNLAALYAESLMDKHPWDLWTPKGDPKWDDTVTVVNVLRRAIEKNRRALGLNHYALHLEEAGPFPYLTNCPADFLNRVAGSSGHLQHMGSHSYLLMGDYAGAVEANSKAIDVDNAAFATACAGDYLTYSKAPNCLQLYYGHYTAHNYFFRGVAEAFRGRTSAALDDADRTAKHAQHFLNNEPGLQRYMTAPLMFYVAFGDWQRIPSEEPPPKCYLQDPFKVPSGCHILRATWRWARGMALAKRASVARASRDELALFITQRDQIKTEGPTGWGNNSAVDVLAVAEQMLLARIHWAEGKQAAAIDALNEAVKAEDKLVYDEPPQFIFPTRQALGGAYLAVGDLASAETAFAADLERHKENGRSLYGMWKALEPLPDKKAQAEAYRLRYRAAWADADPQVKDLTNDMLWPVRMQ